MADVSAVVVTLDALPWVERCLASVHGHEAIVVDVGSTDGTLELVRERFPEARVLERENRGLAAAWNAGIEAAGGEWLLLLNADAWAVGDAVERLVGFPTLWRLATEYLFLRKLAPRSRVLNAFYGDGFDHDRPLDVDWLMGACLLVRRAAVEEVGPADERFFLFSEETDWCYRFRAAGWRVLFFPGAEFVHVGGAAHGGSMYRENLRGQLRFIAKHRGLREAERARRLLLVGVALRAGLFPAERARAYRDAMGWLASGSAAALLGTDR